MKQVKHSQVKNRPIQGPDRVDAAKMIADLPTAIFVERVNDSVYDKEALSRNITDNLYATGLNQVNQVQAERLHSDVNLKDRIDKECPISDISERMLSEKGASYIMKVETTKEYLKPNKKVRSEEFSIQLHNPQFREIVDKIKIEDIEIILNLDATGSIVQRFHLKNNACKKHGVFHQRGRIFNYFLAFNSNGATIYLAENITSMHNAEEIGNFLRNVHQRLASILGAKMSLIKALVIDFSFAELHAAVRVFNNMTLVNYINAVYNGLSVTMPICLCISHFVHSVCRYVVNKFEKAGRNPKLEQFCEEVMAAAANALDFGVINQLYECALTISRSQYVDIHVLEATKLLETLLTSEYKSEFNNVKVKDEFDPDEDIPEFKNQKKVAKTLRGELDSYKDFLQISAKVRF